jgi:hypothetical protein
MVLQGDEAQVKAHFGPFGDSVHLKARWVCDLHRMYHYAWKSFRTQSMYHQAWKSFWTHLMELLGDMGYVESRISLLETVLVSV